MVLSGLAMIDMGGPGVLVAGLPLGSGLRVRSLVASFCNVMRVTAAGSYLVFWFTYQSVAVLTVCRVILYTSSLFAEELFSNLHGLGVCLPVFHCRPVRYGPADVYGVGTRDRHFQLLEQGLGHGREGDAGVRGLLDVLEPVALLVSDS